MFARFFSLLIITFALTACAADVPSRSKAGLDKTDREACMASCNRSYSVCGESSAARRDYGPMNSIQLGASADCASDLRACTKRCQAY